MRSKGPELTILTIVSLVAVLTRTEGALAATSTWTQTDWSGGVGTSTTNQYSSVTDIDPATTSGQTSLTKDVGFAADFESADLTGWTGPWWDPARDINADCVGAWQAQGAASLADSYTDLSGTGNDLTLGVAPGWGAGTGWVFSGSEYFFTGLYVGPDWSVSVQYSNTPASTVWMMWAMDTVSNDQFGIAPRSAAEARNHYHGQSVVAYASVGAGGNLAMAGRETYANGVEDGPDLPAWAGAGPMDSTLPVGCLYMGGGCIQYFTGNVESLALYSETLTGDQVAAVASEMAGSLTQVSRDTVTTYNESVGSAKVIVQADREFVLNANVGDTDTYYLEGYLYTDGSAVTDTDAELYYNGATITTTYEDMGSGWYKISGEVTGADADRDYGIQVKSGKTVYADDLSLYKYESTGTLNSAIYDTSQESEWGVIDWTAGGGGTLQIKARTGNDPDLVGTTDFSLCNDVTSGSDLSDNNCVTDGDQYIQYAAYFTSGSTPVLEEVSIDYDVLAEDDGLPETGQQLWPIAILGCVFFTLGVYMFNKPREYSTPRRSPQSSL